jgi:hypothetical protein
VDDVLESEGELALPAAMMVDRVESCVLSLSMGRMSPALVLLLLLLLLLCNALRAI